MTRSGARRPYWQPTPCPSWCHGQHHASDVGTDRRHASWWEPRIRLSLADALRTNLAGHGVWYEPVHLLVYLDQGYREGGPRVCIASEATSVGPGWDLRPAEAARLGRALLKAVTLAVTPDPVSSKGVQ